MEKITKGLFMGFLEDFKIGLDDIIGIFLIAVVMLSFLLMPLLANG